MRKIHEQVDDEIFLDLALNPKEITRLQEEALEPTQIILNDQIINIWVRPFTDRELYQNFEDDDF